MSRTKPPLKFIPFSSIFSMIFSMNGVLNKEYDDGYMHDFLNYTHKYPSAA